MEIKLFFSDQKSRIFVFEINQRFGHITDPTVTAHWDSKAINHVEVTIAKIQENFNCLSISHIFRRKKFVADYLNPLTVKIHQWQQTITI